MARIIFIHIVMLSHSSTGSGSHGDVMEKRNNPNNLINSEQLGRPFAARETSWIFFLLFFPFFLFALVLDKRAHAEHISISVEIKQIIAE